MKRIFKLTLFSFLLILMTGCSSAGENTTPADDFSSPNSNNKVSENLSYNDISFSPEKLSYAEEFAISTAKGYSLLTINGKDNYLIVEEGMEIPGDLPGDIKVLSSNSSNIYNASSSTMVYFSEIDQLSKVSMTSTKEDGWSIEEVKNAMEEGKLKYVGKYNAPDFEYIAANNCPLAIENTMIFHSPKTKELIENLGTTVMIDYSSYENNPLGRMEWIKVYGLICGEYEKAVNRFDEEVSKLSHMKDAENTGQRVAFFYISSSGYAVVRKPGDYITKMIEMAGGEYAFNNAIPEDENALSTMRMQMESFFTEGYDADILIYNSTIDGGVEDLASLLDKSPLFSEFKAFKEGRVFCTQKDTFQDSMSIGRMTGDMYEIIHNKDVSDKDLHSFFRLK